MDFFYYDFISKVSFKIAFFGLLRPVALQSKVPVADSGSGCPGCAFEVSATSVYCVIEGKLDIPGV